MKHILLIVLLCSCLVACESKKLQTLFEEEAPVTEPTLEDQIKRLPLSKVSVITFDGCEYVIYKEEIDSNESMGFMAHKGNCKNTMHCKNSSTN